MQNLTFNLKTLIIWIVITYLTQVSCLLLVTNQKNISKEKRTKGVSTAKCITTYNFLGQNVCATLCISAKKSQRISTFHFKIFFANCYFFSDYSSDTFLKSDKTFLNSFYMCEHLLHTG